jgi:hypothetical protein
MGSERIRRRCGAAAIALASAVVLAVAVASVPPRGAIAAAAEPWWVPVGLRGQAVTGVVPAGPGLLVRVGGQVRCVAVPGGPAAPACSGGLDRAGAPAGEWSLRGGRVVRRRPGEAAQVDPAGPELGASARLLAAPAALPGVVVAVAADGTVWRRNALGTWARSLLLLPAGLVAGVPPVTGLAAFDTSTPTTAVYLGTDGYAVLVSTDGGDDWFRAAPGLPAGVLALATDGAARAVYAGTRDGVWVHHLQALPAPPVYPQQALLSRWLVIAALAAAATVAALAVLGRLAGPRGERTSRR